MDHKPGKRGVWVGGAAGLCCWAARRAVRAAQAAAASVADVETVHKKDRPACGHTSRAARENNLNPVYT